MRDENVDNELLIPDIHYHVRRQRCKRVWLKLWLELESAK